MPKKRGRDVSEAFGLPHELAVRALTGYWPQQLYDAAAMGKAPYEGEGIDKAVHALASQKVTERLGAPIATLLGTGKETVQGLASLVSGGDFYGPQGFDIEDEIANTMGIQAAKRASKKKPIKSYQEGTMAMRSKAQYKPGQATAYQSPYVVSPVGGMGGAGGMFNYMAGLLDRQMKLKEAMAKAQLAMMQQQQQAAEEQLRQAKARAGRESNIWQQQLAAQRGLHGGARAQEAGMPTLQDWKMMSDPMNVNMPGREGAFNRVFGWLGPKSIAQMQMQKGQNWADVIRQGSATAGALQSGAPQMMMNQGNVGGGRFMQTPIFGGQMGGVPPGIPPAAMALLQQQTIPGRSAEKGGRVPKTGTYKLHKGEIVLNKSQSDTMFPSVGYGPEKKSYQTGLDWSPEAVEDFLRLKAEQDARAEELLRYRTAHPAGPGTVEDIVPGGFSPRSGGAIEDIVPGLPGAGLPGGTRHATPAPEAGMATQGGRFYGQGAASKTGSELVPSSPESLARYMGQLERVSSGPEKQTIREAQTWLAKAAKKGAPAADDVAKWGSKLTRAGKWGAIAGGALIMGAVVWGWAVGKPAAEPGAAEQTPTGEPGTPEPLGPVGEWGGAGRSFKNMPKWLQTLLAVNPLSLPSAAAYRYAMGRAGEAPEAGAGEALGEALATAPAAALPVIGGEAGGLAKGIGRGVGQAFGVAGEALGMQPPQPPQPVIPTTPGPLAEGRLSPFGGISPGMAPRGMPEAPPLGIEGLSITEGPISEAGRARAPGQETVKKYTLESPPESDKERAERLRNQADAWGNQADYYQSKADALLEYVGSMDRPNPDVMKLLAERQKIADKYKKREEQAVAEADKIMERETQAQTMKDVASIEQRGRAEQAAAEAEAGRMRDIQEQFTDVKDNMKSVYNDFIRGKIDDEAFQGGIIEELRPYMPYLEYRLKTGGYMTEEETIQDFISQAVKEAAITGRMDPLEAIYVALDFATGPR